MRLERRGPGSAVQSITRGMDSKKSMSRNEKQENRQEEHEQNMTQLKKYMEVWKSSFVCEKEHTEASMAVN